MRKHSWESCIKRKSKYCPNSSECYNTIDKQFYQNRIMLLEENQQLKEQLELSEKARKEAVELVKYSSLEINTREYGQLTVVNSDDVLNILDIDKGEMKDE